MSLALSKLKKRAPAEAAKPKKKLDRFDGLTEEEVQKYTLEDILEPDLDLVFVGINPSLMAAHRGRYYAGPGNHFYKLLHASGLVPRFVSFEEDRKLLNYKIGLTNIVARATRSSADLKKPEIKKGSEIVREKIKIFKPKVAIFNGKCIYEVFADKTGKSEFHFGLQPERVGDTAIWVVPSSSARCAHFPRMVDKLHFYVGLKKFLSFLKGEIDDVDQSEFKFEGKCKQSVPSTSKMWRRKNVSAFLYGGRVANKDTVCLDTSEENVASVCNSTEFIITEIIGGNVEEKENPTDREKDEVGTDEKNILKSISSNELERSAESSTGEELPSQEIKCQILVSPGEAAASSAPSRKEKNLKRRWKCSPEASSHALKPRENSEDFMNLIKQRLSEKKCQLETENEPVENSQQTANEGKKLKYANLRLNSGKKMLSIQNLPVSDDLDSSICSD